MDENLTKELAAQRAAVVAHPLTLARALELVDWLQATPDGLLATNVARESLFLFAALVRPLVDEEVTPAETIDLGLGNTAMNAEYWSRCTRKTEDPAEAVMCMEQARNAWKNAAYSYARKLKPATEDHTRLRGIIERRIRTLGESSDEQTKEGDKIAQSELSDLLAAFDAGEPA